MKRLVFTGGHHTSALAVAKELKNKDWQIIWFGHRHSMWGDTSDSAEYKDVTAADIKFYDLQAGKFYRTYNPLKLLRIPWGFIQAFIWLLKLKPAGIVSFGGYLAVPTVITGWLLGIKAITHEQTVVSGWANKLIAQFATKIAVTWPSSLKHYPSSKTVLTGLPLRQEIIDLKNTKTPKSKNSKPVLFITGGKQGSHIINKTIFDSLSELTQKYHVIHQTGSSTIHNDLEQAQKINNPNYEYFAYSSELQISSLARADIVISRAGAHSIYELGILGKKCVLVPIPWVSHHEQDENAKFLQEAGLAIILSENNLSSKTLMTCLDSASKLSGKTLDLPLDAKQKLVQLIEHEFK